MRIANFNIRATPPMRSQRVRADLRAARRTGAKVLCWQELAKLRRYRRLLRDVFEREDGWRHHHLRRRCAISVDTAAFVVLRARVHKLTGGNALLPQPSRYSNELVVRPRSGRRQAWAVLSSHFDNGGYNGRWRPRWNRRWRQRRWDRQFDRTRQLVHELHEEGLAVVGAGDYNRKWMRRFHPEQETVLEDGIMKMWFVPPPGGQVTAEDFELLEERMLNTDHAGMAASIHLAAVVRA